MYNYPDELIPNGVRTKNNPYFARNRHIRLPKNYDYPREWPGGSSEWIITGSTIVAYPTPPAAPIVSGNYVSVPDVWLIEGAVIVSSPSAPSAPTVINTEVTT